MNTKNSQYLIANLEKASDFFKSLGDITDLYYDETAHEFGCIIEAMKLKIEIGSITDDELKKLWLIFAPTCAWDDFGGNVELGNQIFKDIEAGYSNRIKREMKSN